MYEEYVDIVRYVGWAKEICPDTQKEHVQGWIQFVNPKDFTVVRKMLGGKMHVEKCMGSEHQNQTYISKENNPEVRGQFVTQGFRTDLEGVKKMLDSNVTMKEIADCYFGNYVRYHSGFEKYKQLVQESQSQGFRDVDVLIFRGPTGTGKTRAAVANPDVYKIQGDDLQWWDGYTGQKTLVIDEYDNQVKCTKLLGILDGYQLRLPIKGGFTYAAWDRVIITTNNSILHPSAKQHHRDALERRIDEVIDFDVTE